MSTTTEGIKADIDNSMFLLMQLCREKGGLDGGCDNLGSFDMKDFLSMDLRNFDIDIPVKYREFGDDLVVSCNNGLFPKTTLEIIDSLGGCDDPLDVDAFFEGWTPLELEHAKVARDVAELVHRRDILDQLLKLNVIQEDPVKNRTIEARFVDLILQESVDSPVGIESTGVSLGETVDSLGRRTDSCDFIIFDVRGVSFHCSVTPTFRQYFTKAYNDEMLKSYKGRRSRIAFILFCLMLIEKNPGENIRSMFPGSTGGFITGFIFEPNVLDSSPSGWNRSWTFDINYELRSGDVLHLTAKDFVNAAKHMLLSDNVVQLESKSKVYVVVKVIKNSGPIEVRSDNYKTKYDIMVEKNANIGFKLLLPNKLQFSTRAERVCVSITFKFMTLMRQNIHVPNGYYLFKYPGETRVFAVKPENPKPKSPVFKGKPLASGEKFAHVPVAKEVPFRFRDRVREEQANELALLEKIKLAEANWSQGGLTHDVFKMIDERESQLKREREANPYDVKKWSTLPKETSWSGVVKGKTIKTGGWEKMAEIPVSEGGNLRKGKKKVDDLPRKRKVKPSNEVTKLKKELNQSTVDLESAKKLSERKRAEDVVISFLMEKFKDQGANKAWAFAAAQRSLRKKIPKESIPAPSK